MTKSVDALIAEADEIIQKNSSSGMQKKASDLKSEDIFKLAEKLVSPGTQKVANDETAIRTIQEKVASSMAIIDTILNLPMLKQLDEFEKAASEMGKNPEEVQEFIKKAGATKGFKSIRMPLLKALGLGAGGGVAASIGHKKGERQGYAEAIEDVDTVMRQMDL